MYDMSRYQSQIEEMVETTRRLGSLGYVASHGGNLSYRVDEDLVLITATKRVKRTAEAEDIVAIDMDGAVVHASGGRRPTGETPMHTRLYRLRPDLNALVHAHPAILTGFALTNSEILSRPLLPEPIIEVGPLVSVAYAEPVSDALAAEFDHAIGRSNAWLMRNHGITVGSYEGVGRALDLMEMLEAMAMSVSTAIMAGRVNEIPKHEVLNLERTLRGRGMPWPGDPRQVNGLVELYFD